MILKPGCQRWWSRGSQTWHWWEAAKGVTIRLKDKQNRIKVKPIHSLPCPHSILPQLREGQSGLSSGTLFLQGRTWWSRWPHSAPEHTCNDQLWSWTWGSQHLEEPGSQSPHYLLLIFFWTVIWPWPWFLSCCVRVAQSLTQSISVAWHACWVCRTSAQTRRQVGWRILFCHFQTCKHGIKWVKVDIKYICAIKMHL